MGRELTEADILVAGRLPMNIEMKGEEWLAILNLFHHILNDENLPELIFEDQAQYELFCGYLAKLLNQVKNGKLESGIITDNLSIQGAFKRGPAIAKIW